MVNHMAQARPIPTRPILRTTTLARATMNTESSKFPQDSSFLRSIWSFIQTLGGAGI